MACYSPLKAHRLPGGSITFAPGGSDFSLELPCGQCLGCRLQRSREWSIRMLHETKSHVENCFITLTYDDEHLPQNNSISKAEVQKFIKRLRKNTGCKFRYYAVGEYGDKNNRPHYHALLFGFSPSDKKYHSGADGYKIYKSETISKAWQGRGLVSVGNATLESAAYCARYCLKKITGVNAEVHYKGREPEFALMSRRPGIGKDYFDKYGQQIYKVKKDYIVVNGKKTRPPKYYDKLVEKIDPLLLRGVKTDRTKMAYSDSDFGNLNRLDIKHYIARQKNKTQMRKL